METRAPIQSDSDTLRDGIENESFDRNNAENDTSVSEQNPTDDGEHNSERGSEGERDLNSQASDSTSTYSNDPKTTIEVTTINIPVESIDGNQSQSETENASSV